MILINIIKYNIKTFESNWLNILKYEIYLIIKLFRDLSYRFATINIQILIKHKQKKKAHILKFILKKEESFNLIYYIKNAHIYILSVSEFHWIKKTG